MPQPLENDYYKIGGMQVDVNPFQQKDEDCNLVLNWYTHKYQAKKVRFGYTQFLDNPDNQPVRNLIFYQFPSSSGLLRVSNQVTYQNTTFTGSWGSSLAGLGWGADVPVGTMNLKGSTNYVHMSESVNGYKTWDGSTATAFTGGFTPKANYLTAYQSRSFADVNKLSIAESFIAFNLSLPGAAGGDPFYFDTNSANPNQGGTNPIDSGNRGNIVGLNTSNNLLLIYKQRGIYRFDGQNFQQLNFNNAVLPGSIATSDMFGSNYFQSYNSFYSCDGQTVAPISYGINTIIQDTYTNLGNPTPLSFTFDYMSFFWMGNISLNGVTLTNAMFVRDERFGEWYIWTIGHQITCFGSYTDSNNVRYMLTGDNLGNTYVWGEKYNSDNGTAIPYRLRTKYIDHGMPSGTKVPQPQLSVSAGLSGEANVSIARNFSDNYIQIGTARGFFAKFNGKGATYPQYKNMSVEISGSTTTVRPEFYGWTINFDEEERFSSYNPSSRQSKP